MRRLLLLIWALLVLFGGGCVPTTIGSGDGAGVGVFSYVTRDVKATYNVNLERAWPATLSALEQLHLTVEHQQIDDLDGALAVKRADGTDVTIRLTLLGSSSTRISIRVGTLGNQTKSVLIHEAIRNALST
ncbi:hypothetical protein C2W62_09280 [Candidatus Entotheonella serta]|nr:hypothetical protein C2W62_09280 [Candidatus Entotheonella serta]